MNKKKLITIKWLNGNTVLHIETPLGIINIRPAIQDPEGHPVDSIEILADNGITLDGYTNNRLIDERPPKEDQT